jgi:RNA polymerase sigma-70 factor (ECF subfamily)
MPEYNDVELLDIFHNNNKKNYAFELIIKKYQERLYWHVRKLVICHHDTDDIMQNVFTKVWKGLENFRGDSELFTWLYRIATNESLTFLKKKRTRFFIPFHNIEEQLKNSLESDEFFTGDQIQLKLQKAILKLPDKQRLVFNMKYFDNMKYEKMSKILDTSIGALKASYHHATKKIEKYLLND